MKDFFVPKDLLLFSDSMGTNSDFSVRGFSAGMTEDEGSLTVTVTAASTVLWTPAETSTVLWLDASDTTTATTVDGKISQRADKSGNGLNATQSTAGNRPVSGTNKDDYDGVDDRLIIADSALIDAPAYIAAVAKANVTGQYKGLLDKWASGIGWMIDFGPTATQGRPRLTVNGTALVSTASVHNTLSIIEAQIAGASSFIGTPAGVKTGTLPTPTNIADALAIGGDDVSTLATDLDFHEMIFLASAPDTELRQTIQGYLAHKWDELLGVTTLVDALPLDHPYKSAPPSVR